VVPLRATPGLHRRFSKGIPSSCDRSVTPVLWQCSSVRGLPRSGDRSSGCTCQGVGFQVTSKCLHLSSKLMLFLCSNRPNGSLPVAATGVPRVTAWQSNGLETGLRDLYPGGRARCLLDLRGLRGACFLGPFASVKWPTASGPPARCQHVGTRRADAGPGIVLPGAGGFVWMAGHWLIQRGQRRSFSLRLARRARRSSPTGRPCIYWSDL
jgi:hypothetical protein